MRGQRSWNRLGYGTLYWLALEVERQHGRFIKSVNKLDVGAPGGVEAFDHLAAADHHMRRASALLELAAEEIGKCCHDVRLRPASKPLRG